ncbi:MULTISPECIES: PilZ domain-containing protein [unclassified Sphingomonas]|jgi:PilZ domain|uniref:PilZ domain-containing protein n=1 Tax=unclassified Sphingomonas TaxID=196159 RepID=UPI000E10134A|nr:MULTISPECIES: PilZ domain-containing protein [unclassified Sphingomonas]AXJ96401.1 PilZ domain-containing protein [Sphingomonas sp. FARSPH]
MFAAEYEDAESNGRRRSPRAPVSLDAQIGKAARTLCRVVDISIHGARLQTYSALKRGSVIWLTLPEAGSIAADVMWADDFVAGCQFQKPLDPEVFDRLVASQR